MYEIWIYQNVLFHFTSLWQNRAARIRVGKGDRPLTYEQAYHPHHIGHRKGWLSQHTSKNQSMSYITFSSWRFDLTTITIGCRTIGLSLWQVHNIFFYITGNLEGVGGAADRVVEDLFIRRFLYGTFHGCLADELVIKRRGNILVICAVMIQKLLPPKFYFLIGYTEQLLSHFYKCPVKMEVQTVEEKVVYKYLWDRVCWISVMSSLCVCLKVHVE